MVTAGVDSTVEGRKDTDVGQSDVIARPRIELPLELSYEPSMHPAPDDVNIGPLVEEFSEGPQVVASGLSPLSSLDGLVEGPDFG
jgi:hypothetical protein